MRARVWSLIVSMGLVALVGAPRADAAAPTWPQARQVWVQDFEGGAVPDFWEDFGEGAIQVTGAAAYGGSSGGLAVDVSGESQAYLQRYSLDEWPHLEFPRPGARTFRIPRSSRRMTTPAAAAAPVVPSPARSSP